MSFLYWYDRCFYVKCIWGNIIYKIIFHEFSSLLHQNPVLMHISVCFFLKMHVVIITIQHHLQHIYYMRLLPYKQWCNLWRTILSCVWYHLRPPCTPITISCCIFFSFWKYAYIPVKAFFKKLWVSPQSSPRHMPVMHLKMSFSIPAVTCKACFCWWYITTVINYKKILW